MKRQSLIALVLGILSSGIQNSYAVDEVITVTATVPAWAIIEPSTTDAQIILDGRPGEPDYKELLLSLRLAHNSAIGYTLEATSANNGFLVGVFDSSQRIPYQISYDSQAPVVLTYEPQDLGRAATSISGAMTNPLLKSIDIIVTNAAANAVVGQRYEDTITFTLTGI